MKTYWIVLSECTSFKKHRAIFIKGGPNPGPQDAQTNWHKTKIQNIGTGVAPRTVHIDNQAETVSGFTYLGSDIDTLL